MKESIYQSDYPENFQIYGKESSENIGYEIIRENGREDYLLVYTLGGCGRIRHTKREIIIEPQSLLLFEPRVPQHYATASESGFWDFLWLHFVSRETLPCIENWVEFVPGIRVLDLKNPDTCQDVEEAMRRAIRFSGVPECRSQDLSFHALKEVALLTRGEDRKSGYYPDPRIRRACDYLSRHYYEPFSLQQLTKISGLSVSRLCHLFHKETGMTPGTFLEERRMQHARALLQLTQSTVSEIANQCGYEDALYFSKRFKRKSGISPRAYRLKMN